MSVYRAPDDIGPEVCAPASGSWLHMLAHWLGFAQLEVSVAVAESGHLGCGGQVVMFRRCVTCGYRDFSQLRSCPDCLQSALEARETRREDGYET